MITTLPKCPRPSKWRYASFASANGNARSITGCKRCIAIARFMASKSTRLPTLIAPSVIPRPVSNKGRNRWFADSSLEGDGFEPKVPRRPGQLKELPRGPCSYRPSRRPRYRCIPPRSEVRLTRRRSKPGSNSRSLWRGKLFPAEMKEPEANQGGLEKGSPFSLRNQWFESISLQRRVCKPSVPSFIADRPRNYAR